MIIVYFRFATDHVICMNCQSQNKTNIIPSNNRNIHLMLMNNSFCHCKVQMNEIYLEVYLTKRLNSDHATDLVAQPNAKFIKQPEQQYTTMIDQRKVSMKFEHCFNSDRSSSAENSMDCLIT